MVAAARSISSIIAEIRERSDHVNSDFVTNTELEGWVNQSAADLHDLIVDYAGPEAVQVSAVLTLTGGTDTVLLPDDYYRLVGVDAKFDRWRPLRPFAPAARRRLEQRPGWTGPRDSYYRLVGRTNPALVPTGAAALLQFIPEAPRNIELTVWYIPLAFDALLPPTGGDPLPGRPGPLLTTWNGWDEYIICDVAAKILEKKEGDQRPFIARREAARARIISAASKLDTGEPARVRDASAEEGEDPYDWLRYT